MTARDGSTLLARQGRHEAALRLLACKRRELDAAAEYCAAHARTADVRLDKYGYGATDKTAERRAAMKAEGYTRGALSVDSKLA